MRYWLLFIGAIGGAIVQMLGGWDKPIKYTLDTRNYKIFTDITEILHEMSIGKYSREIDGVPVIPEPVAYTSSIFGQSFNLYMI